jgi:predicted transcriptional regulator
MLYSDTLDETAQVIAAFVANNSVPRGELLALIRTVHATMARLSDRVEHPAPKPAASILKSITPDHLICLDDGKKFKSLKRHLAALGLTSEQYREKWKLPPDYPMVAPNYAAKRSVMAKAIGLGRIPVATGAPAS